MTDPKFTLIAFTIDDPKKPIVVEGGLTWDQAKQEKTEVAGHGLYIPEDDAHDRTKPIADVEHTWYPISSILKLVLKKE